MILPRRTSAGWMQGLDFPSQLREEMGWNDYELFEEDDEFVLTINMPGFDLEEIDVMWDGGVLNVAAEHVDDSRGRKKTYHRRFRFPRDVDDEEITGSYKNGVLEVHLPVQGATTRGSQIPIEG